MSDSHNPEACDQMLMRLRGDWIFVLSMHPSILVEQTITNVKILWSSNHQNRKQKHMFFIFFISKLSFSYLCLFADPFVFMVSLQLFCFLFILLVISYLGKYRIYIYITITCYLRLISYFTLVITILSWVNTLPVIILNMINIV